MALFMAPGIISGNGILFALMYGGGNGNGSSMAA